MSWSVIICLHETLFKVGFLNVVKTIESEAGTLLLEGRVDKSRLS